MKQKLSIVRSFALFVGVGIALAFGATQAWATVSECTRPPNGTCLDKGPNPNIYCIAECLNEGYEGGGFCYSTEDCCVCSVK